MFGRVAVRAILAAVSVAVPAFAQSEGVREEVVDASGQVVGFIDWTDAKVHARGDAATAERVLAEDRTGEFLRKMNVAIVK